MLHDEEEPLVAALEAAGSAQAEDDCRRLAEVADVEAELHR
ncbi:MAG: hypothetical protein R2695_01085 [Acidimicrobiales bacterium]